MKKPTLIHGVRRVCCGGKDLGLAQNKACLADESGRLCVLTVFSASCTVYPWSGPGRGLTLGKQLDEAALAVTLIVLSILDGTIRFSPFSEPHIIIWKLVFRPATHYASRGCGNQHEAKMMASQDALADEEAFEEGG
jgi:hypothetical protein